MKKFLPVLFFLICIIPLAWPSTWPMIYPDGWWKFTLKLPVVKSLIKEKPQQPPIFKLSQGMLHITPGGKKTFGTIKRIIDKTDQILICLELSDRKEMIIPADYGEWIDLESILLDEWMKDAKMSWE